MLWIGHWSVVGNVFLTIVATDGWEVINAKAYTGELKFLLFFFVLHWRLTGSQTAVAQVKWATYTTHYNCHFLDDDNSRQALSLRCVFHLKPCFLQKCLNNIPRLLPEDLSKSLLWETDIQVQSPVIAWFEGWKPNCWQWLRLTDGYIRNSFDIWHVIVLMRR